MNECGNIKLEENQGEPIYKEIDGLMFYRENSNTDQHNESMIKLQGPRNCLLFCFFWWSNVHDIGYEFLKNKKLEKKK
jgi:hypothetical protein